MTPPALLTTIADVDTVVATRWRVRVRVPVLTWEERDCDVEAPTVLDALSLTDQRFSGQQAQVIGVNLLEGGRA